MSQLGATIAAVFIFLALCVPHFLQGTFEVIWVLIRHLAGPVLSLVGLAVAIWALIWALVAFIRWRADRRWMNRYTSVPTPTPEAARLTTNAAVTTASAPAQQAVVPQPAPLPPAPAALRRRTAEDLKIYDE